MEKENPFIQQIMERIHGQDQSSLPSIDSSARVEHVPESGAAKITIYLVTQGCIRARGGRGCTMCGYPHQGQHRLRLDQTVIRERFSAVYSDALAHVRKPVSLRVFTNGSFFDDSELSPRTREHILLLVSHDDRVVDLRVESCPQFLSPAVLDHARESYPVKRLRVTMGLETANDFLRLTCINKGLSFGDYADALQLLNERCESAVYLVLKPPFLSEKEAIDDAVFSVEKALAAGAHRVIINPCHIQRNTLTHHLWLNGRFRPPWYWSLISLVDRIGIRPEVRFSAFSPSPTPLDHAHNCGRCDDRVVAVLKSYPDCVDQALSVADLDCPCLEEWRRDVRQRTDPLRMRLVGDYRRLAEEFEVDKEMIPEEDILHGSDASEVATIVLIKPDAVARGLSLRIRRSLAEAGLVLRAEKTLSLTEPLVHGLYPAMYGDDYTRNVISYYTEGETEVLLLTGSDAIGSAIRVRSRMRQRYAKDELRNVMHAADSPGEFVNQCRILFPTVNIGSIWTSTDNHST